MPGFRFRYRLNGGVPTVRPLPRKDGQTLTEGDMLNVELGEVDLGATGDTELLGAAIAARDGEGSTSDIKVITDADAVYAVTDPNARTNGETLDLTGSTGAQAVAPSSNQDFVVVVNCAATEETLVRINRASEIAWAQRQQPEARRVGGQLNAALARAVVRCHHEYVGRGPTKARAFSCDNVIVVVMEHVMTQAEQSLAADGRGGAVLHARQELQAAMRGRLVAVVEDLTGIEVRAAMSTSHIDSDMAVELFVLDRPVPGEQPQPAERAPA